MGGFFFTELLINNHSDPDEVRDAILEYEIDDDDIYESNKIRGKIITKLIKIRDSILPILLN